MGYVRSLKRAVQRGVSVPEPPSVRDEDTAEDLVKAGRSLVQR